MACKSDAGNFVYFVQDGMSALMVASKIGHIAVVDRLISAGADCDLKSKVRVPEGACLR